MTEFSFPLRAIGILPGARVSAISMPSQNCRPRLVEIFSTHFAVRKVVIDSRFTFKKFFIASKMPLKIRPELATPFPRMFMHESFLIEVVNEGPRTSDFEAVVRC